MIDGQEERLTGPIVQTVIDAMPLMRNVRNVVVTYREEEDGETVRAEGGDARAGTDRSQSFRRTRAGMLEIVEHYGAASSRTTIPPEGPVMVDTGKWDAINRTHIPGVTEPLDEIIAPASRKVAEFQIPKVFEAVARTRADMRRSLLPPSQKHLPSHGM